MTALITIFRSEPAVIIGALITLIEALAIPGAGKIVAALTFIGALITRQSVISPATHQAEVTAAVKAVTPVPFNITTPITDTGAGGA